MFKWLVEEKRAKTDSKDFRNYWTPFQWALNNLKGSSNEVVLYAIQSRKSDNFIDGGKDKKERDAFLCAIQRGNVRLFLSLFRDNVRLHDEAGRSINTLQYLIEHGSDIKLVKALVEEGVIPHNSMLSDAVNTGNADLVDYLLSEHGELLDVNKPMNTKVRTGACFFRHLRLPV